MINVSYWNVEAKLVDGTHYRGKALRTDIDGGKPTWKLMPLKGVAIPIEPAQLHRVLNVMVEQKAAACSK